MPNLATTASNLPAAMTPRRLCAAMLGSALLAALLWVPDWGRPGDPLQQLAAALAALLLSLPALFSWHKRGGGARRPRAWFVAHVLCSLSGAALLAVHLRGADLFSPPGLVVLAMVFLLLQGLLARALLGRPYAQLFARAPAAFAPQGPDRAALARVIESKRTLLERLAPGAQEAVFSLLWQHWLARPRDSWAYARLARRERALVGAARGVSPVLRYWRALHMAVAVVFYLGLLAHLVVVLVFADYTAAGQSPYWWHFGAAEITR